MTNEKLLRRYRAILTWGLFDVLFTVVMVSVVTIGSRFPNPGIVLILPLMALMLFSFFSTIFIVMAFEEMVSRHFGLNASTDQGEE